MQISTNTPQQANRQRSGIGGPERRITNAGTLSIFMLGGISLLMSQAITGTASAAASYISMTVPAGITLSVLPDSTDGTFATSDYTTPNISVSTNNYTGYTLSFSSEAGSYYNYLENIQDPSIRFPSVAQAVSADDYADTAYATSNNLNNTWGYRPSKLNSTSNTLYLSPPFYNAQDVIDTTSAANATANEYNIAVGARIDLTIAPGIYANTFKITAVANPMPYSITYDKGNTSDTVANLPSPNPQVGQAYSDTVTLSSTVPTRNGYLFKEWCTSMPDAIMLMSGNYEDFCRGPSYPAGAEYPIDQISDNNTSTLYAAWVEPIYMQGMPFNKCTTAPMTVYDNRDNQPYTVVKLTDGKCWMTTNLNLAGGTALSSDDTDFISAYTLPISNGWTVSNDKLILPASSTVGFSTDNAPYVYNTGNTTNDCSASGCHSYYSWDAATIGSGRSINTDNTDAPYSICPKGWKLPTTYNGTDSSSDYRALMIAYGGTSTIQTYTNTTSPTGATMYGNVGPGTALGLLLSGSYYNNAFNNGGAYGYYWSATSYSSNASARFLRIGPLDIYSARNSNRRYGFPVRCVLHPSMQDFSVTDANALSVGQTTTLRDVRDHQSYTVAKLADGNIWMTKNLNLAGGTALSPEDTDFVSSYTLPTSGRWVVRTGKLILPGSSTTGFNTDNYAYVYNSNRTTNSCTSPGCHSYYSWDAATIGSGRNISADNTDAPYSICPKGWKLPTTYNGTDSSSDFRALMIAYGGSDSLRTYDDSTSPTGATIYSEIGPGTTPNLLLGGYYLANVHFSGGANGSYWSATSASATSGYKLIVIPFHIGTANFDSRRSGSSVRCVFSPTMQDFTIADAVALETNQTITLRDARDGQKYTVAKLRNNRVWMTTNLNLTGGTALSPGDTDLRFDYNVPNTNGWTYSNNRLILPTSSITGFSNDNYAYVYNSGGTACPNNSPCLSYYSWDAATVGSGRSLANDNADAPYSICPKGWRLPRSKNTPTPNSDFYQLATSYGMGSSNISQNTNAFYTLAGPNTIPDFRPSGYYTTNQFNTSGYGYYWSATSSSSNTTARALAFSQSQVDTNYHTIRRRGHSVRCIFDPRW